MPIAVRIADDGDAAAVARLRRLWSEENAGGPIEDGAFEAVFGSWWEAERSTRTFFLAETNGAAVGMANVKRYRRMPMAGRPGPTWWGYVGNVFVDRAHRNAGVGRELMEEVIRWAAASGLAHLRLAPSERSRSFYERLGFRPGSVVELDPPAAG